MKEARRRAVKAGGGLPAVKEGWKSDGVVGGGLLALGAGSALGGGSHLGFCHPEMDSGSKNLTQSVKKNCTLRWKKRPEHLLFSLWVSKRPLPSPLYTVETLKRRFNNHGVVLWRVNFAYGLLKDLDNSEYYFISSIASHASCTFGHYSLNDATTRDPNADLSHKLALG